MGHGPLAGITVVEAGSLIAGPFCGQLLGDLGATVIKVEAPGTGDPFRAWGKHAEDGAPVWWAVLERNKKSVTCNLRTPEGQDVFRDLVANADVLVENFRPGTLGKWGLGPDVLERLNPGLITAQVSGFGQTGPYSSRAGYASIGEAMAGLRYINGYPDRPPIRSGLSLGDSLAGVFASLGVLAALHERHSSALGQRIDTSIYESALAMTETLLPDHHLLGYQRERHGATLPGIAPSNVYPTADDSSLIVAANQDTVFSRLCDTMSMSELATDERFADHKVRGDNADELDSIIGGWTRQFTADVLLEMLHESGVPAGRINRAADILEDPQVRARESVAWVDDEVMGSVPMPNVVPRLSRTPGAIEATGPALGAHTDEVLREVLGYSEDRVAHLHDLGAI